MTLAVSYPGVYVQEFTPAPPIQGVTTSVTALLGPAPSGPILQPTLVTSWDQFKQVYGSQPVLYVTEVHEVNEPTALAAVASTFDWSDLHIYDVNAPGLQHGILLGTRRWPL